MDNDCVNELATRIYNEGYSDGYKQACEEEFNDDEVYIRGLNNGWECARKIASNNGLSCSSLLTIFGCDEWEDILAEYSALVAIEKVAAYEKEQKKEKIIKVGDEIKNRDTVEVVTCLKSTGMQTIDSEGNVSTWYFEDHPLDEWEKTGRHFPQITELLAQMKDDYKMD